MQITKCKDTDPPNKFYICVQEGCFSSLFSVWRFLSLGSHRTHSFTVLRRWSWLRSELRKPLIIPKLNHFDGAKNFAETAASRGEGTWGGRKPGSCSNKDFLLPEHTGRSLTVFTWGVLDGLRRPSGQNRVCFCVCPLCFQISLPGFVPPCPPGERFAHQRYGRASQGSRLQKWSLTTILV